MRTWILFLFLLCISSVCFSQTDTTYIRPFEQNLSVSTYIAKNYIYLGQISNKTYKIYMPNNPAEIGLGVSLNNTIINLSYGYDFNSLRNKKEGKTEAFDFQLHNYDREFVSDIFIQKYQGFYTDDDLRKKIELSPDLKIQQIGFFGQYIFNNKRFSYKAAFEQSEQQLKSAGSFLLGGGIYFNKISSDSSFIYNNQKILYNFQFGISGGYGYIWVLNRGWFFCSTATMGINFGSPKIKHFGRQKVGISPTIFPRISAGYNYKTWSVGFTYINDILIPSFSRKTNISLDSGGFQLSLIKRLNWKH